MGDRTCMDARVLPSPRQVAFGGEGERLPAVAPPDSAGQTAWIRSHPLLQHHPDSHDLRGHSDTAGHRAPAAVAHERHCCQSAWTPRPRLHAARTPTRPIPGRSPQAQRTAPDFRGADGTPALRSRRVAGETRVKVRLVAVGSFGAGSVRRRWRRRRQAEAWRVWRATSTRSNVG
jgi:hypothetical protein